MFDYLKSDIRKEINYVTVENVQDETAGKLKAIAQKAKNEKNFEKSIACEEMILEDLGMDNPVFCQPSTSSLFDRCILQITRNIMNLRKYVQKVRLAPEKKWRRKMKMTLHAGWLSNRSGN